MRAVLLLLACLLLPLVSAVIDYDSTTNSWELNPEMKTLANSLRSSPVQRRPVIFIPGIGGSQIWANFTELFICPFSCALEDMCDFLMGGVNIVIYPNTYELAPDCFRDLVNQTSNPDGSRSGVTGVDIFAPGFDENTYNSSNKNATTTSAMGQLMTSFGWTERLNFYVAYWNWYWSAEGSGMRLWYQALHILMQDLIDTCSGLKVVLIAHSQGCLVAQHFLMYSIPLGPYNWAHDHIEVFISIAGPFGGFPLAPLMLKYVEENWESPLPAYATYLFNDVATDSGGYLWPDPYVWGDTTVWTVEGTGYDASDVLGIIDALDLPDSIRRQYESPDSWAIEGWWVYAHNVKTITICGNWQTTPLFPNVTGPGAGDVEVITTIFGDSYVSLPSCKCAYDNWVLNATYPNSTFYVELPFVTHGNLPTSSVLSWLPECFVGGGPFWTGTFYEAAAWIFGRTEQENTQRISEYFLRSSLANQE